ncbi:MAG: glycoside hydrolase family 97 protein [Bacteroidota bacterium]
MNRLPIIVFLISVLSCQPENKPYQSISTLSPSGNLELTFFLNSFGEPGYLLKKGNSVVLDTGYISFDFKDISPIGSGLSIVETIEETFDETWEMPWGEDREVRNHNNELFVALKETGELGRLINLRFKLYDDGLGFRTEFPEQGNLGEVVIMDENTQFNLTGDHKTWWIPGDWDIYEHLYSTSKFSEIDAKGYENDENLAQTYIPENAVNTPVTLKTEDRIYLSFHEANLTDYSGMTLKVNTEKLMFESELVGAPDGSKVKTKTPFVTPWRTVQVADRAGDLIESKLIVNLNEPNKLDDFSWFKPMKYMGIWWEMHLDKSSWDVAAGKHGATTENTKKYVDFASENNIGGLLVEGWNTGWESWIDVEDREGIFDFVTPYPDYDLEEVVRYGKEKDVDLIMHHETSAAPRTYEQQLDTAYRLMESLGIHAVKTGYVGQIIPKGERHHGQWMVNHYRRVLEKGVEHKVAINAHEPIKATGLRRTYPNAISREGLRGQEFNAWAKDGGNPPEHLPIVAFTRMLAGPIDFTPGIFNIKLDPYKENNQVNTTLAHQLALYVVIYSPVQMAADLVEHYENQPAFEFIRNVGVDWEQSKVLDGEIGDFVVIARQERGTDKWFLGAITDEEAREMEISFSFLESGKEYNAVLYADEENAHWDENPQEIRITEKAVNQKTTLPVKLAPGGGIAISIIPR